MELGDGISPRKVRHDEPDIESFEVESLDHGVRYDHDHQFYSTSALEILRETVRILRYNLMGFTGIAALLICPVSALVLTNVLVNQSIVKRLTMRLLFVVESSGLPLWPLVKQSCLKFAEMVISSAVCFPFFVTLSLLSKAAVVYTVDCTYSRKTFDAPKFYAIGTKIWRRVVSTYLWVCGVISSCLTLFLVLLVAVSSLFTVMGVPSELIVYAAMIMGLAFSIIFANAIVICNVAIVISVLEDVSGPQALFRSSVLIRGQTQVGLMIFLGSTIGMAFIEELFEHRVKTLSYGDGTSRIWEGPLLVLMYSFVVLIDSMMSAVFYFCCRSSYNMEALNGESQPVLEAATVNSGYLETE